MMQLDRTRMRLLLRNLLDNALRHSVDAAQLPQVSLAQTAEGAVKTNFKTWPSPSTGPTPLAPVRAAA
jgi:hypothetical protein